jgi:hypothetical protein
MLTIKVLTTAGGNYELQVNEGESVEGALSSQNISLEGATVRLQAQSGSARVVQPNAAVQEGTYVVTKNVSNG